MSQNKSPSIKISPDSIGDDYFHSHLSWCLVWVTSSIMSVSSSLSLFQPASVNWAMVNFIVLKAQHYVVRETEAPAQWKGVVSAADSCGSICGVLECECRGWGHTRLKLRLRGMEERMEDLHVATYNQVVLHCAIVPQCKDKGCGSEHGLWCLLSFMSAEMKTSGNGGILTCCAFFRSSLGEQWNIIMQIQRMLPEWAGRPRWTGLGHLGEWNVTCQKRYKRYDQKPDTPLRAQRSFLALPNTFCPPPKVHICDICRSILGLALSGLAPPCHYVPKMRTSWTTCSWVVCQCSTAAIAIAGNVSDGGDSPGWNSAFDPGCLRI